MSRLRHCVAAMIVLTGGISPLAAQGPAPGPAPAPAANPAAAPVALPARVSLLDAGLFLALAGGAVFAVCRSSRRV